MELWRTMDLDIKEFCVLYRHLVLSDWLLYRDPIPI